MSAHDYLWPARPEYLRRGSVVVPHGEGLPAIVVAIDRGDLLLIGGVGTGWKAAHAVSVDLRDVTARAHAAMAWTVVEDDVVPLVLVRVPIGGDDMSDGLTDLERTRIVETLYRMRMMDEAVTVAEAREALGWAERVAGGGAS